MKHKNIRNDSETTPHRLCKSSSRSTKRNGVKLRQTRKIHLTPTDPGVDLDSKTINIWVNGKIIATIAFHARNYPLNMCHTAFLYKFRKVT